METEVPKVEKKICPACVGSGILFVPHNIPFAKSILKPETCPICNGIGEIKKTRKNNKQQYWICPKIRHLTHLKKPLMTACTRTECVYYSYCIDYLQTPTKEREKLSVTEAFRRSKCYFYEWHQRICIKNEMKTNRIICAKCKDFIENSKYRVTMLLKEE